MKPIKITSALFAVLLALSSAFALADPPRKHKPVAENALPVPTASSTPSIDTKTAAGVDSQGAESKGRYSSHSMHQDSAIGAPQTTIKSDTLQADDK
ncbi:hypothetical protein [Pseudomonas japonica]|uniref:hypothetical protein n=1 Tax=Pseudomonas japonica TaxID=256466 RepID=UPI0015E2D0ED|nr:hypothetical protein [Pseudomonas japonica]MBA1242813.1 hypothetical protein [Pseudomonas japonica]MBA1291148.1 hypothetical protein [Pseudomonas japonica]